jgi:high-affinity Fe2+/Pb2+ permease
MKIWISIITGIVFGFILSYIFLDYNGWTLIQGDENGNVINTTNELDFNLITNSFLIMVVVSVLIYGAWTLIERRGKDL